MSLFGGKTRKASIRKETRHVRPWLEVLEDRTVLTTTTTPTAFTVAAGDVATLIADINLANSNGQSNNVINLTAGTYSFSAANNNSYGPNALPAITSNLTINGNGAVLVRDASLGQNTPFRFFYVAGSQTVPANTTSTTSTTSPTTTTTTQPAGNLTLDNLSLEGGLAEGGSSGTGGGGLGAGGAIFNQGSLTLNGVTVTQNLALGGNSGTGTAGGGGGIGQNASGDNGGGFGNATVSAGSNGTAIAGGLGGVGVYGLGGTSSSSGNGGGGGIGGGGGDSLAAATASTAPTGGAGGFGGGGGAAVSLGGTGGFGGGGGASGASGTGGAGGFGAGTGDSVSGGGGAGLGGAIFNMYGTTMLINTTLASNLAEGGQGGIGAGNGSGYGGAVFNLDGTVTIMTSTMGYNSTVGASNGGGALYNLALGTTATGQPVQAVTTLTDSILASSIASNDVINDQSKSTTDTATINATNPNIVTALSTINGATTNGTPNTAQPILGLLLNYGGPTPTMPLLAGSPALGAGVSGTNVPTTDQRGAGRGGVIDLGAYQATPVESAGSSLTLTSSSSSSSAAGPSVTLTATVTATGGTTTPAGTVQFVDSSTGATLGSATVANGQATLTTTALTPGSHSITATYTSSNGLGASSASTTLTNGSSNQLWLQQVYKVLLNRNIDPSGLAYWTAVLSSSNRQQVAFLITQTTEYRSDEVQSAFQTLLHRAADTPSLTYFVGLMSQGVNIQTIESIIAGSQEYYVVRGGGTTLGFLNAIYQDFLNRPIDSTGQQVWQNALATGTSRTQVVQGLMINQEFMSDLVQNDYQTYLHRAADSNSLNAFVHQLMQGSSNDAIVSALLGSGEFTA